MSLLLAPQTGDVPCNIQLLTDCRARLAGRGLAWLDVALLASDLFLGVAETLFQLQPLIVVLIPSQCACAALANLVLGWGVQEMPRAACSSSLVWL